MGDLIEFYSSEQASTNNIFPFLEKNTLEMITETVDYICIEILSHEKLIAHKTLFIKDAVSDFNLFRLKITKCSLIRQKIMETHTCFSMSLMLMRVRPKRK